MRVTLISHSEAYYSTRRLLEAGAALGHEMARVDPVRVTLRVAPTTRPAPAIVEDGQDHTVPDIVVPRIGTNLQTWSLALLEAWLQRGARSALTPTAIARASDKLATTLALTAADLPVVPTVAVREPFHIPDVLAELPGNTWIFKSRTGTGGIGVAIVHGQDSARSVLGALTAKRETILVQPYAGPLPARDLRVLIAASTPLATYWREATSDEFRTNVHRGGTARQAFPQELPGNALDLAVAAANAAQLPFCGVDLIESPDGLAVLEVNASPGLEGAEQATGRDLATPYLDRWISAALGS